MKIPLGLKTEVAAINFIAFFSLIFSIIAYEFLVTFFLGFLIVILILLNIAIDFGLMAGIVEYGNDKKNFDPLALKLIAQTFLFINTNGVHLKSLLLVILLIGGSLINHWWVYFVLISIFGNALLQILIVLQNNE